MKKIINILLILVLLMGIGAGTYFMVNKYKPTPPGDDTPSNPGVDNQNIVAYNDRGEPIFKNQKINVQNIAFATSSDSASVSIYAVIEPQTATNKNCSWSLSWQTPDETINVNDYINLTQNPENPCEVTVTCRKGFLNNKVILTVTTEDGNYTDTCTITFLGTPTSLSIDESQFKKSNSANHVPGGDVQNCCEIVEDRTYTIDLNLSNLFGIVDTSKFNNYSIKVEGYKEYRLAIRTNNTLGYFWQEPIKASSIKDKVLSCSVTNGKLNIKTPIYDYKQGKDVVMTQWLDEIYYKITVTENTSNVSNCIYVRFVQGVTGVNISNPNIEIG